jgi:hypothetical protein
MSQRLHRAAFIFLGIILLFVALRMLTNDAMCQTKFGEFDPTP